MYRGEGGSNPHQFLISIFVEVFENGISTEKLYSFFEKIWQLILFYTYLYTSSARGIMAPTVVDSFVTSKSVHVRRMHIELGGHHLIKTFQHVKSFKEFLNCKNIAHIEYFMQEYA